MSTVNQKSESVAATPCRILKIGHCPSVSGKSTLTYTASGMFSQEWVAWSAIEDTHEAMSPASPRRPFEA